MGNTLNIPNYNSGVLAVANGGTGVSSSKPIIQRVYSSFTTVATGSTVTPFDNTIPQITEGNEFMTITITPTSATNILLIRASALVSYGGTANVGLTMALHQDSTANALMAVPEFSAVGGEVHTMNIYKAITAGTTSATTFRIRVGSSSSSSAVTFNGQLGTQLYGGVAGSYMEVIEIAN